MSLTFHMQDGVGVFKASGDVPYDDGLNVLRQGLNQLKQAEPYQRRLLFDLSESIENRSTEELRHIADTLRAHLAYGRLALVANSPLQYGLSRMFAAYAEAGGFDVAVFRELDEAKVWLNGDAAT